MTLSPFLTLPLLILVGFVSGVLNVVAGGGSLLVLPLLIFLGIPASDANGTNRVAILIQNLAASWGFSRHRLIDRSLLLCAALPSCLGAVLGTLLALRLSDGALQRALAWVMLGVVGWVLIVQPHLRRRRAEAGAIAPRRFAVAAGFFIAGIYGGFVQAGVGFLILAVTTLAGLDLVRGNALKVWSVLCFSLVSLAMFAFEGEVLWLVGLALGVGHALGGLLGVRLSVSKGEVWIERVVMVTAVLFALRLLWTAR
jgi:hypothetical protein